MNKQLTLTIKRETIKKINDWFDRQPVKYWIFGLAFIVAIGATIYSYNHDAIIAYGDAESHLNIAKRVVDSLTPGLAQLGGIWLPLPHLLLAPLVYFDWLWRTGLAGSIVSGLFFVITSWYIYKLGYLLMDSKLGAVAASLLFIFNPNILYLQSTPMTELPLLAFMVMSIYYFIKFIYDRENLTALLFAAVFGFGATLCRYDGWFLVGVEAVIVGLMYFPFAINWPAIKREKLGKWKNIIVIKPSQTIKQAWSAMEGRVLFFVTMAFFGIFLWLMWDAIILGDPLYFTHSEYSAKSQQQGWQAKGQLPSHHDFVSSFLYYIVASASNVGLVLFLLAVIGAIVFIRDKNIKNNLYVFLLLMTPFIFYVVTLWLGQSIIFIPHLTPTTFEWTLFNVRYGAVMVPTASILFAFLFHRSKLASRVIIVSLLMLQFGLYGVGYSKIISFDDAMNGLSSAKRPDAEVWMRENYDDGLVVLDDFSRLMSIIRTEIPMKNVIYVGNKPYWEESLESPEKYAKWIVLQKNDVVWKTIYEPEAMQGRLYKYFSKAYTSPEILIFKRNETAAGI